MVIDGNRRWLKPDVDQANEFLEKEKDQGMELTMERGLERALVLLRRPRTTTKSYFSVLYSPCGVVQTTSGLGSERRTTHGA